jgi:hypothetical protein
MFTYCNHPSQLSIYNQIYINEWNSQHHSSLIFCLYHRGAWSFLLTSGITEQVIKLNFELDIPSERLVPWEASIDGPIDFTFRVYLVAKQKTLHQLFVIWPKLYHDLAVGLVALWPGRRVPLVRHKLSWVTPASHGRRRVVTVERGRRPGSGVVNERRNDERAADRRNNNGTGLPKRNSARLQTWYIDAINPWLVNYDAHG